MENNNFTQKWDDAQKLFKEFKVVTFGNKKNLMKMIEYVAPEEILRYADFSNIKTIDKKTNESSGFSGTLFISNKRIFLFKPVSFGEAQYYEYPLEKVRSVSSRGNGLTGGNITFTTDSQAISFMLSYDKSVINKVAAILDGTIQNSLELRQTISIEEKTDDTFGVVDCPGCGAAQIVKIGTIEKCDYCDRPLTIEKPKANQQPTVTEFSSSISSSTVSAADELVKFKSLLDSGIITQEEFNHKKETC